ncbi:hypothetical protein ANCCAN_12299 [Ancylostoma caninum]|uniref:Uncharacterized protein n=1 Tax=Ancylostoma caninum TaxID=29170 RepID=A0A368GDK4_ANCCA|nr:hypothetical protein ANCCAN_12299 [Ancylostoma caninum]
MISTKHDASLTQNNKPKVVEDYNNMMGYVDQLTKWLRIHRLSERQRDAIGNAWRLYRDIVEKIRLTDFKMNIIESLLQEELQPSQTSDHKLEQLAGPKAVVRKRCVGCYKEMCQV